MLKSKGSFSTSALGTRVIRRVAFETGNTLNSQYWWRKITVLIDGMSVTSLSCLGQVTESKAGTKMLSLYAYKPWKHPIVTDVNAQDILNAT